VISGQNSTTRPTGLVVISPFRAKQQARKRPGHDRFAYTVGTNEQVRVGRVYCVAAQ
jgi:hypothetical protein